MTKYKFVVQKCSILHGDLDFQKNWKRKDYDYKRTKYSIITFAYDKGEIIYRSQQVWVGRCPFCKHH